MYIVYYFATSFKGNEVDADSLQKTFLSTPRRNPTLTTYCKLRLSVSYFTYKWKHVFFLHFLQNAAYENEAAVMEVEAKRGSPPIEKGQKDTMVSEKMAKLDSTFDNDAYETVEVSVDDTARQSRTTRYTTTTISTSKQL